MASSEKHVKLSSAMTRHLVGNRTESTALLAWFLRNVWRLEESEVEDAICDGGGDKGIDGLTVNADLREVTVFQSNHFKSSKKTQGDAKIKGFVGVEKYFESASTVLELLASKPNKELERLLVRHDIASLLGDGNDWSVRLVFVTSGELDLSGGDYLAAATMAGTNLDVWDRTRLAEMADKTSPPGLVNDVPPLAYRAALKYEMADKEMVIAVVPAIQLTELPGIDDLSLFGLNVRLHLGKRTRINKDLSSTIQDPEEHAMFPAFHNGLTLVTNNLTVETAASDGSGDKDQLLLDGASVVNGCQSLVSLRESRSHLTDDLCVIVKIVELDQDYGLAEEITFRSNNQNSVNVRDQRSSDPAQRALQKGVARELGLSLHYIIREGEGVPDGVERQLDNARAAQLILAARLGEPHNAVRKLALFDKQYHRIFSRDIGPHDLLLLALIDEAVQSVRTKLDGELSSSFSSVRFTLTSLVAELLKLSSDGEELWAHPDRLLPEHTDEVLAQLADLATEAVHSVNFYVEDEEKSAIESDTVYDPKTVFKSASGVRRLTHAALSDARRAKRRDLAEDRDYGFLAP